MKPKKLLSLLAVASITSSANAAVIQPIAATSTSTVGAPRTIDRAIDGSGLVDVSDPSSVLDDEHVYGTGNNIWLSSSTAVSGGEELTFDLQGATTASYDINGLYHWAYTRDNNRNLKTFDISYSTDGGATFIVPVAATSLGMADWGIQGNARENSVVEARTFSTLFGVTDIRFSNLTTHGSTTYIALGEIRFNAVPEPSAALFGGMGALALLRRRRI